MGNRERTPRVQPDMTNDDHDLDADLSADLALVFLHLDGAECPDFPHTQDLFADLDELDRVLRAMRDEP